LPSYSVSRTLFLATPSAAIHDVEVEIAHAAQAAEQDTMRRIYEDADIELAQLWRCGK
jgi:hypothetical protein